MKKRTIGFVLALAMSFSMTGCGGSAGSKQEEPQETVQETMQESDGGAEQEENAEDDHEENTAEQPETESELQAETPVMSGEYASQTQKINDAMALIDESKTYTSEEFYYLMQDICEVLGTNYTTDIMEIEPRPWDTEIRLNLNGAEMKKIFEEDEILWFLLEYVTGDPIDAFISVPPDAEGEFNAMLYYVPHSDER